MANIGQKIIVGPTPTLLATPYNGNLSDTTPVIIKNSIKNSPASIFIGGPQVLAIANSAILMQTPGVAQVANPLYNVNQPISITNPQFLPAGFELEAGQSIAADLIGGEPLYGVTFSGLYIVDVLIGRQ